MAKSKFDRSLLNYSQAVGVTKKEKDEKYLTIQSLLDHPYFLRINTADISSPISLLLNDFESMYVTTSLYSSNEDCAKH